MKQIIQNYKNGELKLEEVPVPQLSPGRGLVKVLYSLISGGSSHRKPVVAKGTKPNKVLQCFG